MIKPEHHLRGHMAASTHSPACAHPPHNLTTFVSLLSRQTAKSGELKIALFNFLVAAGNILAVAGHPAV
jgi:hypothetical protein